jgi:hypothetical protein
MPKKTKKVAENEQIQNEQIENKPNPDVQENDVAGPANESEQNQESNTESAEPVVSEVSEQSGEQSDGADNSAPNEDSAEQAGEDSGAGNESDETPGDIESTEEEEEVKTGFEKVSIRAACSATGEPFRGSYRTLQFDDEGVAVVSIEDKNSIEQLQEQFPGLEIKQA